MHGLFMSFLVDYTHNFYEIWLLTLQVRRKYFPTLSDSEIYIKS